MKNYLILSLILILTFQSYSQGLRVNSELPVSINTDGASPNSSAMLDVKSTSKGVLIPRMTSSQRNNINSPAKGLLVFDTNTNTFWFHNGSTWKDLGTDTTLTESQVDNFVNNNGYLTSEVDGDPFNEIELPTNPQSGMMVYYNGSDWVSIPPGTTGQKLCYCDGVPTWGPCPPTCSDGIKNQNETGVDCGGVCPACPPPPCDCPTTIFFETPFVCSSVVATVFSIDLNCLSSINWYENSTCCGGVTKSSTNSGPSLLLVPFNDNIVGDISVSATVTLTDGTICPTITKLHNSQNCD